MGLTSKVASLAATVRYICWRATNDFEQPSSPSLDDETLAELKSCMRTAGSYLEYGTGGSTVLAAQLVSGPIYGVESDAKYLRAVKNAIAQFGRTDIHLSHVNIGPVAQWGRPLIPWRLPSWEQYPKRPWHDMHTPPDLILIDGRFRVACVLECLLRLPESWKGTILVDDYEGRPYYKVLESFVDRPEIIGRALKFGRGNIDTAAISAAVGKFYGDMR